MGKDLTVYKQQMLEAARSYAEKEKSDARFVSIRGGKFKLGEDELPGNQIIAVIAHSVFENTFYDKAWDDKEASPPRCYAMADDDEDMAPHPSMQDFPEHFTPQAAECRDCKWNKWGSGKGNAKACQNRRRLALVPAGYVEKVPGTRAEFDVHMYEDENDYRSGDMYFLKLPPTSQREFAKYVKMLAAEHQLPPYGVITRVEIVPDDKSQYKVVFEPLAEIPDDLLETIIARHEQAKDDIITGYVPSDSNEDEDEQDNRQRATSRVSRLRGRR